MDRRTYLRAAGVTGALATVSGCLDRISERTSSESQTWGPYADETTLDPPSERRGNPVHPIHGDELPSFAVPDPLTGETITDEQFRGERAIMTTFIFTNCPGPCSTLLQYLVQSQQTVRDEGLADEVVFLAVTFDPERDTATALETHADDFSVDLDAGNWHFLRPDSEEALDELLAEHPDGFGMPVQRIHPDEADGHGHDEHGESDDEEPDDGHDDDDEHDDGNQSDDGGDEHTDSGEEYTFEHFNLILLANDQGIVERAYPRATTRPFSEIEADLLSVLED